jgi:predicted neutral ceramidase superfamily lipid hydrolase
MTAAALWLFASVLASDFQAGAASIDITPPAGVPMAGYYYVRYNEGTHDPLHAKALVFEKDGRKAALVALDLIGVPAEVADRARVFVEGLTSVPGANLMVSATHSHTGPEMGSRLRNVDPAALAKLDAWRAALPAKIAEAVKAAEANLQPVRVQAAVGHEDSVSFIRRFRMLDGSVAWNPAR